MGKWIVTAGLIVSAVAATSAAAATGPTTVRISVGAGGVQANGPSQSVDLSGDARFVLFNSQASNLVPGDTNRRQDVFLRDRGSGRIFRVSVGAGHRQANGRSWGTAVSADGRFVLFMSQATNLTRGRDQNGSTADVFLRDRRTGTTSLVSVTNAGRQYRGILVAAGVSNDGRYVAFGVYAPQGKGEVAYIRDRRRGTTRAVAGYVGGGGGGAVPAALSASGQWVLIQNIDDHDAPLGLFVKNIWSGRARRVSPGGSLSTPVMTADAHFIVYADLDNNGQGWDVFRRNRITGKTATVLANDTFTNYPSGISANGRYVSFISGDPALVPGDTNGAEDLFRKDMQTGVVSRLSLTAAGGQIPDGVALRGTPGAGRGLLSADGTAAVFESGDPTVVSGDTNNVQDVFLRRP